MAEQRLPKVNQDDGTWGDILRQYLMKEHYNGDADLTQATSTNGGHQFVTIRPGTTSTAPLTLTSGSLLSTPAIGAIEFNNDTLYFTKTTGTTRMQVVMDTATQTLTNKTLTSPTISAPTFSGSYSFGGTPTWPTFNQSTTGSAATLTTSRNFQTNLASTSAAGFNGSADNTHGVTGTLPVTNGGTGRATSTTAYGIIAAGTTATGAQQTIAPGTTGQFLKSAGASALASFATISSADLSDGSSLVTLTGAQVLSSKTLTSPTLTTPQIVNNGYIADANGNEQIVFGQTASAVNQIKVTNAATTTGPTIAADGNDTNIDLNLNSKGTGQVKINGSPIPSDANLVHKTGVETIAGDKTFSDNVTINDIAYTKEIRITPTNGTPQSAAFTLDNDNGQVWQFTNNSGGDFAFWNQTANLAPFYVAGDAPQNALGITSGAIYSGLDLGLDNNKLTDFHLYNGVIETHPESAGQVIFPHMVNDIAFNTVRGGSTIWKKNGVVTAPNSGADNIFLPDATFAMYNSLAAPTTDTITIEITLRKAFNWGVNWGIVMTPWCCAQNVQLEVWDNTAGSWATAYTKTNDDSGMHWVSYAAASGHDMTKIRWTLTNFNNPDPRITQVAAIEYNSPLLSGTFLPRGGGNLYGDLGVPGVWTNTVRDSAGNVQFTPGASTMAMSVDMNMQSHKVTNVTNPTSAQDAATKSYVDTATASLHTADGNLVIGGDFQNDAMWANAWGSQTTEQALPTGGKSHKIISTGGGAATDYISLTHDGTGTPSTIPGIAPRIFVWKIQLRKKSTNVGGGNLQLRTVCTDWSGSTASATTQILANDLSNSVFQYWDRTHTVSSAYRTIQFRIELDSGVPAGDAFYIGAALITDVTGAVTTSAEQTLSFKRITPRMISVASDVAPTYNTDKTDLLDIYALATNITSMTTNMTGSPTSGQKLMVRIKGDATPRTITWGSAFVSSGVATPITSTIANREHHILFVYSDNSNKWVCLASDAVGY